MNISGPLNSLTSSRKIATFIAPALGVEPRHFVDKHFDLIGPEQGRKEKIAVALEMLKLLRAEPHREIPCRPLPDYRPENARSLPPRPAQGAGRGGTT